MDIDGLLYHYLTDGIQSNHKNHVGIELEFPLVRDTGGEIDLAVVPPMFEALTAIGYHIVKYDEEHRPLKAKDDSGHVLTFDTCFENVEFASASAPDFWPIYRRFRETLRALQQALGAHGHHLLGLGYNPHIVKSHPHLVESELTLAIAEYFREHPVKPHFPKDFYCMVSSEQVHFNTDTQELPLLFEVFTRLDWMNILLFADSPAHIDQKQYLCARNELYMRSAFRAIGLVGAQSLGCETAMDIARSYRDIALFMRQRDGKTEVFPPTPVSAYFERPEAQAEDIHNLDLERNIVTTAYGTVEYRMLCAQPFTDAFTPSAFNLGLRVCLSDTLALCRAFDQAHSMPEPNERNRLASMEAVDFATHTELEQYARALLAIARDGLVARGFGEEAFLRPLEARTKLLDCPSLRLLRRERAVGAHQALMERAALGPDITA